ncbi:MAG: DASS family sodium-coupled anion symporter [Pseudomonadota bacterium]|nr:DASS family sodium-coupled anion symporter [Pseudomonadota bacterium]MEC8377821.1 DASS family sodium-coupled anion symporter [Pseudomonadota bacterium]
MNSWNIKSVGFWLGLISFIFILIIQNPIGLSTEGRLTLAVFSLMGIWWAFEALPLQVTALMPLVLFPLLGVVEIGVISKEYMNKVQFLFAGGFIIAIAIQKWGLHKRVALNILRLSGLNANGIVASFMLASALLSMWVMNTSTAIMLLPVAISVIKVITDTVKEIDDNQSYNFQLCLLLGIAYSASLGGIATPIGTSPNGVLIQFAGDNFNKDIGFANWIAFGLPVTIILGPLVWYLLTKFIYPVNFKASINAKAELETMLSELGAMTNEEKKVVIVFTFTAFCWIFRQVLDDLPGLSLLDDSVIAMIGGLSLFFINRKGKKEKLLDWEDAQNGFPWGLIFLFGGGMALAYVVNDSGLALWLASLIPSQTYFFIVLFIVITMVILLTELTSNLTTTVTFLPVVASVGLNLGIDPMLLILPLTLSASCAFMLPVATPPNSIVYASGLIPIQKMVKAGIIINLLSIIFLFVLAYFFIPTLI